MPRSSGTFTPPVSSWYPTTTGASASKADWDALLVDLSAGLTQSVSKDGQTAMTGNLPMGNNKLTGLAAGSAAGESLRWEQLFSQGAVASLASAATVDIGAQNTTSIEITGAVAITSLGTTYNGPRHIRFTGAPTLTYNATTLNLPGATNITVAAGDICIAYPNTLANGWNVLFPNITATQTAGNNSLRVASTAYVDSAARGASFSAYRNAALNLVTSAITALVCDVEENDIGANFASGIFTCPAGGDGEYQFNAMASFQNIAAAQPAFVILYKNGVRNKDGAHLILDPTNNVSSGVSAKISLVAGDTVQPYIYQQSGSTIGIGAGNIYTTYFQGMRVRAA